MRWSVQQPSSAKYSPLQTRESRVLPQSFSTHVHVQQKQRRGILQPRPLQFGKRLIPPPQRVKQQRDKVRIHVFAFSESLQLVQRRNRLIPPSVFCQISCFHRSQPGQIGRHHACQPHFSQPFLYPPRAHQRFR